MAGAVLSGLNAWELGLLVALGFALTLVTGSLLPRVATPEATCGIVSLQLAGTASRARALVHAWSRRGMLDAVRRNVLLDFPFLAAYSTWLALFCLLAERAATASDLLADGADDVGTAFAAAALAAGVLDAAENAVLLGMLDDEAGISPLRSAAATGFAALKFALVATAAGWIVSALLASIVAEAA